MRGRVGRVVAGVLVLLVGLVAVGLLGQYQARLAEVQENDNAAFLPANAESTEVTAAQAEFFGENVPAVLVWEDPGGVDKADLRRVAGQLRLVADVDLVVPEPVLAAAADPSRLVSADGQAVQVAVPLATSDGDELEVAVTDIRAALDSSETVDGLTGYVTGPAGVLGDFVEAFGAIDGLLVVVALVVVLVILLAVYRSPLLPLAVLLSAVLALSAASALVYVLTVADVIDLNGQSQGILFILVVGAATDYALLLVSRFREELREHESSSVAMRVAWRGTVEPIVASALTVVLGLLCLLLADLTSLQGLGPVGAIGVAMEMVVTLTFLPPCSSRWGGSPSGHAVRRSGPRTRRRAGSGDVRRTWSVGTRAAPGWG